MDITYFDKNMLTTTVKTNRLNPVRQYISLIYPLISEQGRISIWKRAAGLWKNRKPDPIKELNKMRQKWN